MVLCVCVCTCVHVNPVLIFCLPLSLCLSFYFDIEMLQFYRWLVSSSITGPLFEQNKEKKIILYFVCPIHFRFLFLFFSFLTSIALFSPFLYFSLSQLLSLLLLTLFPLILLVFLYFCFLCSYFSAILIAWDASMGHAYVLNVISKLPYSHGIQRVILVYM